GVSDAALLARLERTMRPAEQQSEKWRNRQMAKVDAGLKAMSAGLKDTAYCAGNQYTLADVAVGCTLGYLLFRFPEINWREDYPNLDKLYEKLCERPSFKETAAE
ncbi:MAG TPA: glutathione S-transferase C-terminal domain-containing protein, partial [Oxalicibacterium sp.]|nr:glutathione S-transferase C-terminal domain-containing protein [Oxalicibacterium sp.]